MKVNESQMSWNQQDQATVDTKANNQTIAVDNGNSDLQKSGQDSSKESKHYRNLSFSLIEGFVTAKPKLMQTKSGKWVCHFSIANHYSNGNNQGNVSFLDIEAWEKRAQNCDKYLDKGKRIIVQGYLRQDRWENAKGEKRSQVKLIADNITFLSAPAKNKE